MADTVVSMARSMLEGAISTAAAAATAEMSILMDVRKDIWFIKDELETMQAFLELAEGVKKKDVLLKVWAKQVRDLSYNIEDCLGEFMVHVGSQSLSRRLLKLKDRHSIALEIRDLKSRVQEVSNRSTRYSSIKTEASSTIEDVDSYMEDIRNHSASNIDEDDLVGFSEPKKELIRLMDVNNEQGPAKVIWVVGMGGLGKTTLARKIYEGEEGIMKNFSCFAWITVSQSFFKIEMLKDMIRKLLGKESLKECLDKIEGNTVKVEDLTQHLTREIKDKRYFIILDDLWTIDAWKWIKSIVFPSNNRKGSRVIVTTRDVGLAKKCTSDDSLIYPLKPLQIDDATKLLLRNSRKTQEDIENNEITKTVVIKIVKKCGCLPLALLTIGGMLANKTVKEWESIYEQIPSELESNSTLEAMRKMVTLSYSQLPSHLKSCFLYLSIFPEDFEINRRCLVERWIAEGFVRARCGVSIEDVAISFFNELINRSMIQPSRVNIEGIVKTCRVHDIVRDVMVSITRDENFVYLVGDSSITSAVDENFRHVAYHGSMSQKIVMDWSHVRSLTMFGERPMTSLHSLCSPDLRMLRALDVANAQFGTTQKDINNIGLLRHLKYLNVQFIGGYSNIYKLPRSIRKLQGLQMLDLRDSYITTLPTEICELQGLRTLRCSKQTTYDIFLEDPKLGWISTLCILKLRPLVDNDDAIAELHMARSSGGSNSHGVKMPRGISNLKQLQILGVVDIKRTSNNVIVELGELTQLKKLRVATNGASLQNCEKFCATIEKLSSLRSLRVDANEWIGDKETLEWLHSISSPPLLLRSLHLNGSLVEMPDWVESLIHLVKISLRESKLKEGGKTMETLGTLPNLMLLGFDYGSYDGETLVFGAGVFLNLRKLYIHRLDRLREVRFEEGTLPQMETIEIICSHSNAEIIGIKHLSKLKEITVGYVARLVNLGVLREEVNAHPNHPVLRLKDDLSYRDPGPPGRDIVQGSQVALAAEDEPSQLPELESVAAEDEPSQLPDLESVAAESSDVQDLPTTMSNSL